MQRLTEEQAYNLMGAYQSIYTMPEGQHIQEDFEKWVYSLAEEGYDMSDYTWDEMYDYYVNALEEQTISESGITAALKALSKVAAKTKPKTIPTRINPTPGPAPIVPRSPGRVTPSDPNRVVPVRVRPVERPALPPGKPTTTPTRTAPIVPSKPGPTTKPGTPEIVPVRVKPIEPAALPPGKPTTTPAPAPSRKPAPGLPGKPTRTPPALPPGAPPKPSTQPQTQRQPVMPPPTSTAPTRTASRIPPELNVRTGGNMMIPPTIPPVMAPPGPPSGPDNKKGPMPPAMFPPMIPPPVTKRKMEGLVGSATRPGGLNASDPEVQRYARVMNQRGGISLSSGGSGYLAFRTDPKTGKKQTVIVQRKAVGSDDSWIGQTARALGLTKKQDQEALRKQQRQSNINRQAYLGGAPDKTTGFKQDLTPTNIRGYMAKGSKLGGLPTGGAIRKEEVDLYDVILDYLLSEGFANSPEDAIVMMANMSEEWKNSIIESLT